jgi:integrase
MKTSDHLFRVGRIFYAWTYEELSSGKRKRTRKSTGCTDRTAALRVLATWERKAADPKGTAKAAATLGQTFALLLATTHAKATSKKPTRSVDTVAFQSKQSKAWLLYAGMVLANCVGKRKGLSKERVRELGRLGEGFALAEVDGGFVDAFTTWRRGCGVGESTIGKDLSVLRPACRLMLRAGKWGGSLEQVFPRHELDYEPGDRWLPLDELALLKGKMEPHRFAVVAYAYALGAEPRAITRALRSDLADPTATMAHVRGTKRKTRDRWVPIRFDWQRDLLDHVRAHADGEDGKLFGRWSNQRRVLGEACARASIDHATITAMRHSFAHLCKSEGIRQEDLFVAMGHTDSKMLDRIYGKASSPNELVSRFDQAIMVQRAAALTLIQGGKGTDEGKAAAG